MKTARWRAVSVLFAATAVVVALWTFDVARAGAASRPSQGSTGQREEAPLQDPPAAKAGELATDDSPIKGIYLRRLETPAPAGNAEIVVELKPDAPRTLRSVRSGTRSLELHAEADNANRLATVANIDLDALTKMQRSAALARGKSLGDEVTVPVFRGRSMVEQVKTRFVDFRNLPTDESVRLDALPTPTVIRFEQSLMIIHPLVVDDPVRTTGMGKWTFGHLMTEMANEARTGITPSQFTRRWLRRWQFDQTVNDFTTPARPNIKSLVIDPWITKSGGDINDPEATLDLAQAPFRLLAIVNRIDLRLAPDAGGPNSAGEARFVYGVLDNDGNPLRFTVIFEYGIMKENPAAVRAWGKAWADLSNYDFSDETEAEEYKAALELLTEQFVSADSAPSKPNGSALNQLRTNEIALGNPWELREFRLAGDDFDRGHLRQVTVKQTPHHTLQDESRLSAHVNANAAAVINEQHLMPFDAPPGQPFIGGAAETPFGFAWRDPSAGAPFAPRQARHMFSLQTCNGCHAGETGTQFLHVAPRNAGEPTILSGFLLGNSVADPVDHTPVRPFNDLTRRVIHLDLLVNMPPGLEFLADEAASRMVH